MNHVLRTGASLRAPSPLWQLTGSFFHSTPVLERKRKSNTHSRFNYYARRKRKFESKKTMVRNLSDYAEYLFQSWRDEDTMNPPREQASWFRKPSWVRGEKKANFQEFEWEPSRSKGKKFDFCTSEGDSGDDTDDIETIFRTKFGGVRFTYWSFDGSDEPRYSTAENSYKNSRGWRYESEDESDSDSQPNLASERRALGLNAYGPLKLEEVKNAYRTCALRWHPDRHQGLAKVQAEEKFKHCSTAYKTLCDSLVTS